MFRAHPHILLWSMLNSLPAACLREPSVSSTWWMEVHSWGLTSRFQGWLNNTNHTLKEQEAGRAQPGREANSREIVAEKRCEKPTDFRWSCESNTAMQQCKDQLGSQSLTSLLRHFDRDYQCCNADEAQMGGFRRQSPVKLSLHSCLGPEDLRPNENWAVNRDSAALFTADQLQSNQRSSLSALWSQNSTSHYKHMVLMQWKPGRPAERDGSAEEQPGTHGATAEAERWGWWRIHFYNPLTWIDENATSWTSEHAQVHLLPHFPSITTFKQLKCNSSVKSVFVNHVPEACI